MELFLPGFKAFFLSFFFSDLKQELDILRRFSERVKAHT
jgi:hypothetical protein